MYQYLLQYTSCGRFVITEWPVDGRLVKINSWVEICKIDKL